MSAKDSFIRSGTLARRLDLHRDTVRRQLRAGMYGPPVWLHGEWAVRVSDYEAWLRGCQVAASAPRVAGRVRLRQFAA